MNKKFATLLFAVGLGIATAPAFAAACEPACGRILANCLDNHIKDIDSCVSDYENCIDLCSY